MVARFVVPKGLSTLVKAHEGQAQKPVRYRPSSWRMALDGIAGNPDSLLTDPAVSVETACWRFRPTGDRDVTRDQVLKACTAMDLGNASEVIRAFVLVMAWGSGTTNNRSLRNTRKALKGVEAAAIMLSKSAEGLRAAKELREVLDVYGSFRLPGVREPFFTKWFAFAGRNPDRHWQPLILDSRVRATLNKTLAVWLNDLAENCNDPYRYIAYVEAMHEWAAGAGVSPECLEWIFFNWNGKPLQCSAHPG